MGVRGELFSTKVALQNRTYFFNVKENRLGDLYLNIVESKNRDEGGFDRQSVILFAEDLQEFLQGFDEALRVLEKAGRDKRRGTPSKGERREEKPNAYKPDAPAGPRQGRSPQRFNDGPRFQDGSRPQRPKAYGQGKKDGTGRASFKPRNGGKPADRRSKDRPKGSGDFAPRKKRVVVKKR